MKLTKTEREVLTLLTQDYLTVKQVAQRRKTSDKAVYKTVKKLREKGLISKEFMKVEKSRGTLPPTPTRDNIIRLHGTAWNLTIKNPSPKYKLEKANLIYMEENTIKLYSRSIQVYINKEYSGASCDIVEAQDIAYINKIITRLEDRYNIKVIRVKRTAQHFSIPNNELAKETNKERHNISLKATEDGKQWLLTDNSFKLNELETVHPATAKEDMAEVVMPFFNDLRDNTPPVPSEVWKIVGHLAHFEKELGASMLTILELLKANIPKPPQNITPEDPPDYFG